MNQIPANQNPIIGLLRLKQTGTVTDYRNIFEILLGRVNFCESYAISLFIEGLEPVIKEAVNLFKPRTLAYAYALAKLQESTLESLTVELPTTKKTPLLPTPSNTSKLFPKSLPISSIDFDERKDKGLCLWCDEDYEEGHRCKKKRQPVYVIEVDDDIEGPKSYVDTNEIDRTETVVEAEMFDQMPDRIEVVTTASQEEVYGLVVAAEVFEAMPVLNITHAVKFEPIYEAVLDDAMEVDVDHSTTLAITGNPIRKGEIVSDDASEVSDAHPTTMETTLWLSRELQSATSMVMVEIDELVDVLDPQQFRLLVMDRMCYNIVESVVHGALSILGFDSNVFICNVLVAVYVRCSELDDTRQVFEEMHYRGLFDIVCWSSIGAAYTQSRDTEHTVGSFRGMTSESKIHSDVISIVKVLLACGYPTSTLPGDTHGSVCDPLLSEPCKNVPGWGMNDMGVSFTFGPNKVSEFLHKYDLDLVCPAHQVEEDGYEFFADRQLVIIFSSISICGEFDSDGAMISGDEHIGLALENVQRCNECLEFIMGAPSEMSTLILEDKDGLKEMAVARSRKVGHLAKDQVIGQMSERIDVVTTEIPQLVESELVKETMDLFTITNQCFLSLRYVDLSALKLMNLSPLRFPFVNSVEMVGTAKFIEIQMELVRVLQFDPGISKLLLKANRLMDNQLSVYFVFNDADVYMKNTIEFILNEARKEEILLLGTYLLDSTIRYTGVRSPNDLLELMNEYVGDSAGEYVARVTLHVKPFDPGITGNSFEVYRLIETDAMRVGGYKFSALENESVLLQHHVIAEYCAEIGKEIHCYSIKCVLNYDWKDLGEGFMVKASMNTIDFSLRKNNTGFFLRGLSLMLRSMGKWIHYMGRFEPLKCGKSLSDFKMNQSFYNTQEIEPVLLQHPAIE